VSYLRPAAPAATHALDEPLASPAQVEQRWYNPSRSARSPRQDHNAFSHQDLSFIDHVINKKAEVIRVYLPPDANTLLSVADRPCSRNYVNVIVVGKQPALNYLSTHGGNGVGQGGGHEHGPDEPLHAHSGR